MSWRAQVAAIEAAVRRYAREQGQADQPLDQLGLFGGLSRVEQFIVSQVVDMQR